MSSFSKSQIFSKKAKIQTLHATINILSSLALTQVSGRSPHCSESFLLFVLFSSLFPEQVKVLPDSISFLCLWKLTCHSPAEASFHSWESADWARTCLGHVPWHHCFEDLQKPRTTMDLSCYERQPELVSLGYRSFYRDESSVSCSSDFEAPPPPCSQLQRHSKQK